VWSLRYIEEIIKKIITTNTSVGSGLGWVRRRTKRGTGTRGTHGIGIKAA